MFNIKDIIQKSKTALIIAFIQLIIYTLLHYLQSASNHDYAFKLGSIKIPLIYFALTFCAVHFIYTPLFKRSELPHLIKRLAIYLGIGIAIYFATQVLHFYLFMLFHSPSKVFTTAPYFLRSPFQPLNMFWLMFTVFAQGLSAYMLKNFFLIKDTQTSEENLETTNRPWPVTYKIVIGLGVLAALQYIPYTAILTLFFGVALMGPYIWGLLPHLLTLGIMADIATKRLPIFLLILPVIAYSTYYFFYFNEAQAIHSIEAQLQSSNPTKVVNFDPQTMALVREGEGQIMLPYLKVPVVYTPADRPEGYNAQRLISQELCSKLRNSGMHKSTSIARWNTKGKLIGKTLKQCIFIRPETPQQDILAISTNTQNVEMNSLQVSETSYNFSLNDKNIGTFKSVSYLRLPAFPFILAMYNPGLGGPKGWAFELHRSLQLKMDRQLDTFPPAAKKSSGGNIVASMLDIEQYEEADFEHFMDDPKNKEIAEEFIANKLSGAERDLIKDSAAKALTDALASDTTQNLNKEFDDYQKKIQDGLNAAEDVALLARAIKDPRVKAFGQMWYPVRNVGSAGSALAKPMIDRMLSSDPQTESGVIGGLDHGMLALPSGAAAQVATEIEKLASIPTARGLAWRTISRLADSGERAIPTYIKILQTPYSEYDQRPYAKDREVLIGALSGLCKMREKAIGAKAALIEYVQKGFNGNAGHPLYADYAMESLTHMMTNQEYKQLFGGIYTEKELDRHIYAGTKGKCNYWM